MLKQGTAPREFTDAASLRAHHAEIRNRIWTPPPAKAVVDPQIERQERLAAQEAELEARRAEVMEVLDPVEMDNRPRKIIARIAQEHGLTYADLVGRGRTWPVLAARRAAMVAVRAQHPKMSLPRLGQHFNRDHTTVLHALHRNDGISAKEIKRRQRLGDLPSRSAEGNIKGRRTRQ